jgi:hypothetical protein
MNLQDFATKAAALTTDELFALCASAERVAVKLANEGNVQAAGAAWGIWKCYEALLAARGFARG